ncbi:MAG: hypothetical protein FWD71_18445 [Oscillospiraceae bacterium]|nr:hypothetical protein [Oscillospiraceae bacterium]
MDNVELKIKELTKKIESEPNDAAVYNELAGLYHEKKDYQKSKENAYKAIELEPENPEYLADYGNSLGWLENYDEAIEYLSRAIKKDGSNSFYYFCRGNCYQHVNDEIIKQDPNAQNRDGYKISLGDYDKAIELEPDNAEYYYIRDISYAWIGDWQKAHENYGKAFEINPKDMRCLSEFAISSPDIQIHLGYEAIPIVDDIDGMGVRLDGKIKNLRERLDSDYNIYLPSVLVMGSKNIRPAEVVMYADGKVIFQKESAKNNFEDIIDEIVNFLERIFSREYVKSDAAA